MSNRKPQLDPSRRKVNIIFSITPGNEVLVNRINISGNTKTSDKVIRREMQVQEQEPYSATAIRHSKRDSINSVFSAKPASPPRPRRSPTRSTSTSTSPSKDRLVPVRGRLRQHQSAFGDFQLGETNLFGGGEAMLLSAQIGFLFQNYTVSYTEPWFLDIPLAVSLSVFDSKTDLFTFHQNAAGGAINQLPAGGTGLQEYRPILAAKISARDWATNSKASASVGCRPSPPSRSHGLKATRRFPS